MKSLATKNWVAVASGVLSLPITVMMAVVALQGCLSDGYYDQDSIPLNDKFFAALESRKWIAPTPSSLKGSTLILQKI
jgi:hypothetical protein